MTTIDLLAGLLREHGYCCPGSPTHIAVWRGSRWLYDIYTEGDLLHVVVFGRRWTVDMADPAFDPHILVLISQDRWKERYVHH